MLITYLFVTMLMWCLNIVFNAIDKKERHGTVNYIMAIILLIWSVYLITTQLTK